MPVIRTRDLHLSFGGQPLLDGIDLNIEPGERVCLVGRNGSGKSSLLKVLEGRLPPDDGHIERQQGLKIASLAQELPTGVTGSVFDCVAQGLGKLGELIRHFHQLSVRLGPDPGPDLLQQLETVQHELEALGGWSLEQEVETTLSRLALDPEARFEHLSGGVQRRALLARALVSAPDLLLLDEPTNHLDIQSIEWLEEFLLAFDGTLLFISHDRSFADKLATRILDLDRGALSDWPGDYQTYQRRKQEWLDTEAGHNALFDKKLAREESWIREGIKARRTRNEGRVRALQRMREERRNRRAISGKVRMQSQVGESSGKLVVETLDATYSIDDRTLIRELSTTVLRGDKIGIIGPNGVGKTTLLRLLLGDLQPRSGQVRLGTKLEIGYFDQRRARLTEQLSVMDNVSDGRQFVEINGQQRHVISYLQDFLFAPERCQTPVAALSGGERNRLLLAILFSKPSNLLVLDEPTNDLDMDTLDLLEGLLVEYTGTVLLVSHDRTFLDNVVSSTLVFEGGGVVREYVGGYSDWLQHCKPVSAEISKPPKTQGGKKAGAGRTSIKLSYKDQRELDQLPQRIEQLERQLEEILGDMSDPSFYQLPSVEIATTRQQLSVVEADLQSAYERWELLEQQKPA